MQFPNELINQLSPNTIKVIAVSAIGLVCSLGLFMLRAAIKRIKQEWHQAKAGIHTMNSRLATITENHLAHVQDNTSKTVELLEKVVEGQAEMNGYLKGRFD